jgi:hypothetical protein
MKNAEDFKKATKERNITRWITHQCSICNYPCGFSITGERVNYDNGCDCAWEGLRPSSFEEIAQTYNMNAGASDRKEREKNPLFKESVEADDKFWGFDKNSIPPKQNKI